MRNRIAAIGILVSALAIAIPTLAAIGIGPSDLHNQLVPQNPVTTWGKVTSTSPLRISDGRVEIGVTGLSALHVGDYLWVEGDWNGSAFTARQNPQKAQAYKLASKTELVYVPAGDFLMGNNGSEEYSYTNELPKHSVYLSGYWIGKYEVTRGEYRRFMNAGGYSNPAYWSSDGWSWKVLYGAAEPYYWAAEQDWYGGQPFTQTDQHPVVGVNYYEAEAFCNWAGGRLPTEAEWEKAARWTGSHPNIYPWGDLWDAQRCNNWYDTSPAGGGYQRYQTAPVGSYPFGASPYGCQDMSGNVGEWCRDWFALDYYWQTPTGGWIDPQGTSSGTYRALRLNHWDGRGLDSRCAYRGRSHPYEYWNNTGFRLAR